MEGVKLNLSRLGGGESGEGKERGLQTLGVKCLLFMDNDDSMLF